MALHFDLIEIYEIANRSTVFLTFKIKLKKKNDENKREKHNGVAQRTQNAATFANIGYL